MPAFKPISPSDILLLVNFGSARFALARFGVAQMDGHTDRRTDSRRDSWTVGSFGRNLALALAARGLAHLLHAPCGALAALILLTTLLSLFQFWFLSVSVSFLFFSFYFCLLCSALAVVCSSAYAANIRGIKIVCAAAAAFHALLRIFASPFALAFFRDY